MYADRIDCKIGPAVKKLFLRGNAVWHRRDIALTDISNNFNHRIRIKHQASKMADIWPIENVCGIIKQDLDTYYRHEKHQ